MPNDLQSLVRTVQSMCPVVPAKDFELSRRFYADLGFHPVELTAGLIEMRLGFFSFRLQNYYVREWADNFAMHLVVTDVQMWWRRIGEMDIGVRYGVKTRAPKQESWGLVAILIDPSGVIWQICEPAASAPPRK